MKGWKLRWKVIDYYFLKLNKKYRKIHDLEVPFEDGGEEVDGIRQEPYGSKDESNIKDEIEREEEEDEIEDEIKDKE